MRKRAPVKAEADVHREGQELPEWSEARSLSPAGHEKVKGKHGKIGWQDAVGASAIELREGEPLLGQVRFQRLLPNEKSAEDKEEVDAHPAEVGDGEETLGQLAEDRKVIEHYDDDGERTEGVEAEEPG